MLYRIEWDSDGLSAAECNIPAFLYIDSVPLMDNESNVYPSNFIYHVSPNDFPEFHRKQYPDCFAPILTYSIEGNGWLVCNFYSATMLDIENYIIDNPTHFSNKTKIIT